MRANSAREGVSRDESRGTGSRPVFAAFAVEPLTCHTALDNVQSALKSPGKSDEAHYRLLYSHKYVQQVMQCPNQLPGF